MELEPTTFMWNGQAVSLPGTYELVPDGEVKHLHRRVMAIALHERKRIPFCGRLVGQARLSNGKGSVWLIEDDRGYLIKSQKPMVLGAGE
ncbi:MAG: hypothetical protein A4E67_00230 [Syntrophaceae bacterium PtaB.Bin038]|nr:MAG: hypothetical protein A4E67_00230 [Syntrophaceae bacterium PtaB.Bin038]